MYKTASKFRGGAPVNLVGSTKPRGRRMGRPLTAEWAASILSKPATKKLLAKLSRKLKSSTISQTSIIPKKQPPTPYLRNAVEYVVTGVFLVGDTQFKSYRLGDYRFMSEPRTQVKALEDIIFVESLIAMVNKRGFPLNALEEVVLFKKESTRRIRIPWDSLEEVFLKLGKVF